VTLSALSTDHEVIETYPFSQRIERIERNDRDVIWQRDPFYGRQPHSQAGKRSGTNACPEKIQIGRRDLQKIQKLLDDNS
jgi:3-deoxy-D-arabino-heptulosonate 7-phosphate (DAHP) synthase class II